MLSSPDQEKFRKDLHQQRNEDHGLQEKNAGQDLRETKPESVPGKTVIRSSGNAKDLRNEILTEQRNVGHAEPHVRKVTEIRKDDRNMDTRRK